MTLTNPERNRLRAQAQALQATVHIGKAGLADASLEELRRQLKDHRLVKVRLLGSATEGGSQDNQRAQELAAAVGAELVEVRGHTVVLWRPRA